MTVIDTNCLVHFFTGDRKKKAEKVARLIDSGESLYVPESVFPELEYVLLKKYGLPRIDVIEAFDYLLSRSNVMRADRITRAVEIYKNYKLDMVDCIATVWAEKGKLASFDKKLLKVKGVRSYWKN